MTLISICIPVYPMAGRAVEMLGELLASIRRQTFTNYEVVISDDSNMHWPSSGFPAEYYPLHVLKGKPGAPANINNAIDHAHGDIIKPMFQDDMFIETDTLQKIADAFSVEHCPHEDSLDSLTSPFNDSQCQEVVKWCALTSHNAGEPQYREYDHIPYPHNSIEALRVGENTYGSPSAMAWRKNDMRFDENLPWLFDCEFYGRMAERYGVPAFIDSSVYIRQWSGMATHTVANGYQRILDGNYVVEKYRDHGGQPFTSNRH